MSVEIASVVDLFCGIGGLTHGFLKEGFNVVAGIDLDVSCQFAYEHNNGAIFIEQDIEEITADEIIRLYPDGHRRILVGCAPCQPFSRYTVRNNKDQKWKLLRSFARLIREVQPDIVSMENVPELESHPVYEEFKTALRNEDYFVSSYMVYCPDYGVPQIRKRLVLFASKFGPIEIVKRTHPPSKYRTVRQVIAHLKPIKAGEASLKDPLHRARNLSDLNLKRIKSTPPGGNWKDWDESLVLDCHKAETGRTYRDVYGRMEWDEPAPTMTTHCGGLGNGKYGHPEQHRAISLREAAIFQTFSKKYKLVKPGERVGNKTLSRQLGNAVPIRLGVIIARSIKRHLKAMIKRAEAPRLKGRKNNSVADKYELTVDLQVLKHLGIGLYSNVPAVVSEMVANAYDADASKVEITVGRDSIIVKDDGLGMSVADANGKFLTVGYDKRKSEGAVTRKHGRKPMGRKGIGKLSAFAIANKVAVRSIKTHPKSGKELGRAAFVMDVGEIEDCAKNKETYYPKSLDASKNKIKGTIITLGSFKQKRSPKPDYIRVNLARRFSVLGNGFEVFVNGTKVSPADRQYWNKLQFVWGLGDCQSYNTAAKGKKVRRSEILSEIVEVPTRDDEEVNGWIGTVHLPKELKDGMINNNGIAVLARGKLVHENLLPFARTSRIFAEYVVGEINADWVDEDSEEDMATSDRQSLREDDLRFIALQTYVKGRLEEIADKWTEWRKEVGVKDAVDAHPVLLNWLNDMTPDNQKHAKKLISTIQGMPVADEEDKKELFRHGIMAFETLALKGNLDALTDMPFLDVKTLTDIMNAMEDLEVAHYYQIAKSRWTVLQQIEKLVDSNAKEKFLQEKIYNDMWLMDVAWERPTRDVRKEKRFVDKLKAQNLGLNKNQQLARYDIKYLSVSGKDLVVELKRSGRTVTVAEIVEQVRKYSAILIAIAKDSQSKATFAPNYEIIVLLGALPSDYNATDETALKAFNARILTYEGLIDHAKSTYGDYISQQKKIERIQKIVDSL